MPREKKTQIIEQLEEAFSKCTIGILTDYRGISSPGITSLRAKFREAGVSYKVVKNTLARLAAEKAGKGKMLNSFKGPIAIAFGYGDVSKTAKVVSDHMNATKEGGITGGFLGSRLLKPQEVAILRSLPSREVLLARVVGGMQSPIAALVSYLSSPMVGFVGVLQARIKQLEGK